MSLALNEIDDVRAIAAELLSTGRTRDDIAETLRQLRKVAIDLGRHQSAEVLETVASEILSNQNQS